MDVITTYLQQLWSLLALMAPYLIFGFLVAGVLSILIPQSLVERHLSGRGLWPVAKAALLGVPMPLCSCGVLPVSASLRRSGASRGATTAFLISTPQTGADNIAIIYGLLGPVVAIFSPIAAFITGLVGGGLVDAVDGRNGAAEEGMPAVKPASDVRGERWNILLRILHYAFVTLPRDIAGALIVGILIAALLNVLIPPGFFAGSLVAGFPGMLLMLAISIPIYVCSAASVPLAASFIAAGVSPGAALVFLIAGPSTNAASISTVYKILGPKGAGVYLGSIIGGALLSGLLLNNLIVAIHAEAVTHVHCETPGLWQSASAVLLLLMLAYAMWPQRRSRRILEVDEMSDNQTVLSVEGMNCKHCVESVRQALAQQPGVEQVEVDLAQGRALITGAGFNLPALITAVESAGYTAKPLEA